MSGAGAPGGRQWKMAVASTVAGRGGGGGSETT